VHSHAGPFWLSCASPLNPLLNQSQSPPMLAGHRCILESDILKFLFGKCPTPTLKAEYTYTLSCISQSRCQKTLLRYNAHWFRYRSWCQQNKLSFLLANPMHVAMFLSNSLRFALSRSLTDSTIKAASAAIFTAHKKTGLDDVTSHSFLFLGNNDRALCISRCKRNRNAVSLQTYTINHTPASPSSVVHLPPSCLLQYS